MNYPCAKVYTTSSSNIKNINFFQFLVILHRIWLFYHGMVSFRVSYLLVDPIFIKIKKYEFACQLTEAINNKRKDDAMEKNILLDLECIALSRNTKSCVGANRKLKLAGNTNAYCVWVWPEMTAGESS